MNNVKFRFGDTDVFLAPWHTCTKCVVNENGIKLYDCCPVLLNFGASNSVFLMPCHSGTWCYGCAYSFCMISLDNEDTLLWRLKMFRKTRDIVRNCRYNLGRQK